ncbi:MAG: hypothetical protein LBJ76_04790, partial [Candidatus Accumulibacter sp.]|nr:hypothetical protein [Accumulibacter sp.]
MRRGASIGIVFALAVVLVACERLRTSTEDRINAAVAVSAEAREARQAFDDLARSLSSVNTEKTTNEYRSRLKVRALECAHGYSPSILDSRKKVRDALTDTECFRRFDESLAQWINMRRVGLLLSAPPLRPIPDDPAVALPADGPIRQASFASQAGVAVLATDASFNVLDLGDGTMIHSSDRSRRDLIGALSPNGRLLVTAEGGDSVLVDSETGQALVRFARTRAHHFFWVADFGAIYKPENQQGPIFSDFTRGVETRIPVNIFLEKVVATSTNGRYALLGGRRVGIVDIVAVPQGWTVKLVSEVGLDYSP